MLLKLRAYQNRDNGFTFIELLIVVLIIGILAAIAIPVYLGIQTQTRHNAVKADANQMVKQVQVALTEGALSIPQTASATGITGYTDPAVRSDGAQVTTTPTGNGQFQVQGVGRDNYTYTYDSKTGQFTEGSADVALGGGNPSASTPTGGTLPAYANPSSYTTVTTLNNTTTTWNITPVVDSAGNVYYTPTNAQQIYKYNPASGTTTTFAGSGTAATTDGTGTGASFTRVQSMAFDSSNNMYLLDWNSGSYAFSLRKVTPAGVVTTLFNYTGSDLAYPQMALGPDGSFYVGSTQTGLIDKFTATGTKTVVYNGTSMGLDTRNVLVDASGNVYFTSDTAPTSSVNGGQAAVVWKVNGVASAPIAIGSMGTGGTGVVGLVEDSNGTFYVGGYSRSVIYSIAATASPTANPTLIAGTLNSSGSVDGPATTTARLAAPNGLAMGPGGVIYFWNSGSAGSLRTLK